MPITDGLWVGFAIAATVLGGCGSGERPLPPAEARVSYDSILPRVVAFRSPPYPYIAGTHCGEPWDCRRAYKVPLVPDAVHALAFDVCSMAHREIDREVLPRTVPESAIAAATAIYVERDPDNIPGLRPWHHAYFIRSLSPSERADLVRELSALIHRDVAAEDC